MSITIILAARTELLHATVLRPEHNLTSKQLNHYLVLTNEETENHARKKAHCHKGRL